MKKICAFSLLVLLLSSAVCYAADGLPLSLAGFTLGKDVSSYKTTCEGGDDIAMSDAPFLSEAHLRANVIPGVRSGSLVYGNCLGDGRLVRIKLKFHDRSQKFFDQLLKKYIDAFGEPDSYVGDAFKNVIAWQWSFSRGEQAVSVILMWSRDKEMRPGVSIKMTLDSLLNKEYDCYRAAIAKEDSDKSKTSAIKSLDEFIPR
jgi:hypothetical protein